MHWDVQPFISGRAQCGFVGLRNGGATCYMNSILQQLFMQPNVADFLLSISGEDEYLDKTNIMYQTQRVISYFLKNFLN